MALLDIELPGMNGSDAGRLPRTGLPECRVIMLATLGRPGHLRRAMDADTAGFPVKDGPVDGLAGVVRSVAAGRPAIDPDLPATTRSPERERDVLRAAAGAVADIARYPHLSHRTVRNQVSSALGKPHP